MDYIFNVRAKLDHTSLDSIKAQFAAFKKDVETKDEYAIKVKAILDTSSLSVKSIQDQLNNQKLTINVGEVRFDNAGLESVRNEMQQVANTTSSVTQQTQQAKQAVQQLADTYKHLAKEQVQAMIGNKLPSSQNIDSNGITVINNKPAEASAQSLILAMNQVQKAYENAFGKGNVDVQGITDASGKIDAFTISAKNAENEILKFRYSLQSIKDEANVIKGFSFDFMGGAFNESAIKDTQEYNKELKNQEKELQRINDLYNNIIASTHEKNKPMLGVDTQNGVISKNGLYGEQSSTLKTQIDTYIDEYSKLKQKIEEIQQTIKSGHTVNQQEIKDLQDREAAFKRLAEVIRSAQYADTQMSSKSVVNQKAILNEEIKEFENDVRNSNLASQDFIDRIHAVNQALQTVGDRNSFRTVYEDLRKLEAEFDSLQKVSQSNAARNSFNVDYSKASASLDEIVKKVQELGVNENELTFTTTDLLGAFANITDKYSLQTFNKMLSQATKEVRQQTQEIQNQEKEWQKLTDLINKAYGEATNSNTNGKAIQDPATIKLLRDQYDTVVVAVNEVRNATTDTFDQSKKSAEQAIQAFIEYSKVLQNSEQSIQATDNAIKKLQTDTSKGLFAQNSGNSEVVQLQQDITNLSNQYAQLQARFQSEGATQEVIAGFTQLDNQIKSTSERAKELQTSLKSVKDAAALEDRKSNLNNKIETWLRNNTRASESMRQSMKSLQTQIQSADKQTLTHLTQQFNELNRTAQQTGQIGKSFMDTFKEKALKFAGWFNLANAFMMITNEGKQALVTLKDVDSILTEISKTSERSVESLEKLGETAFDAASKYGVSVQNYLTGVQEMARAGYETLGEGQSEKMADLALLVQAAGDVSDSTARDYLIATDAAYQLGGSIEKLTKILDGQNLITNRYAVSMQDMTEGTKEAASVAHQYGMSIEELSALIAIAEARTKQGGNVVGNAIKSIMLQISDVTNQQVVKAFDTVGISMHKIVDGAEQLKTPIELLGELAKVFNELPQGDDRRAVVLSDLGGKYRANTLAAILQDWDSMQGIMETYERGAGSAMREANKTVNTLASSLQNLKTSGQEFFSKFFDTDKVTGFLKAFTQLVQLATDLVDTLGAIPTILGTIGATALLKNGGRVKLFTLNRICRHLKSFLSIGSFISDVSEIH